jgi:hypothetical protein
LRSQTRRTCGTWPFIYKLSSKICVNRFLHENSEVNYFTIGAKPVGMCSETTAILVPAEDSNMAPLVKLIRVRIIATKCFKCRKEE